MVATFMYCVILIFLLGSVWFSLLQEVKVNVILTLYYTCMSLLLPLFRVLRIVFPVTRYLYRDTNEDRGD